MTHANAGGNAQAYIERHQALSVEAQALAARSGRLGNLRGVSFLIALIGLGNVAFNDDPSARTVGLVAAAAGLLAFAVLVVRHARTIEAEEHKRRWVRVNQNAEARCTEGWRRLPSDGAALRPTRHPYADDLDLFGPGSVYQRLSVAHTRYGEQALAAWLCEPASADEIQQRQRAVQALSAELDFRQALEAESLAVVERRGREPGSVVLGASPDPEPLLRWAESPPRLIARPWLRPVAWLLPALSLAGIAYAFAAGGPPWGWLVPLLLSLVVLTQTREDTTETFGAVSATEGAFLRYGAMLELFEQLRVDVPWVAQRQQQLHGPSGGPAPSASMRQFRRLVGWFDLRHNGMVYPFINALLLWDVHCALALDGWKRRSGHGARAWFRVLGEVEALSSLAGFLYDEPHSCLPEVTEPSDSDVGVQATALGHPLLAASRRVSNDVESLREGEALLITGSNMSGKSTFLRSVGVSCVLAFAGAPVCAQSFRVARCHVGTSIRVSDSLASGVSHFYAEVEKLKAVVDASQGALPVLFLLDEVLHGTNSRERQIGARWVLAELLERRAFGVVTTHDMELCRLTPELMGHVRQAHFQESVHGDEMTFDYKMREGAVSSGNALRLMRLVGLPVPLDDATPS